MKKPDEAGDRTDLDETRRLLYMVLCGAMQTERWYVTAGTLINALAYHSKLANAEEVTARLRALRDEPTRTDQIWVMDLIDQINAKLGD